MLCVYLDIKPENVMCTTSKSTQVKIIDFGLAKELGGPEKERCGMDGTLEFMAPEVIRMTYCTSGTDMWSLGFVTFLREFVECRLKLDFVFQCSNLHAG